MKNDSKYWKRNAQLCISIVLVETGRMLPYTMTSFDVGKLTGCTMSQAFIV